MTSVGRLASVLLALAGCADVLDIPDDPALVETGPWRCLDRPAAAPASLVDKARVEVAACDYLSECMTPVTGLHARLCPSKADVDCALPLLPDITDQGGLLSFEVPLTPSGFDGYLQVDSATELCTNPSLAEQGAVLCGLAPACDPSAPDAGCEVPLYARSLLFFNPPIVHDTPRPIALPLVPSIALPRLIEAAQGSALDTSTGNLFVTALDCDGEPAAGVSYRIDRDQERLLPLYVDDDWIPSAERPHTDGTGMGGFLGVPPGLVGVTGNDAQLREVGELEAFTAPLTVSYGFVAPAGAVQP